MPLLCQWPLFLLPANAQNTSCLEKTVPPLWLRRVRGAQCQMHRSHKLFLAQKGLLKSPYLLLFPLREIASSPLIVPRLGPMLLLELWPLNQQLHHKSVWLCLGVFQVWELFA